MSPCPPQRPPPSSPNHRLPSSHSPYRPTPPSSSAPRGPHCGSGTGRHQRATGGQGSVRHRCRHRGPCRRAATASGGYPCCGSGGLGLGPGYLCCFSTCPRHGQRRARNHDQSRGRSHGPSRVRSRGPSRGRSRAHRGHGLCAAGCGCRGAGGSPWTHENVSTEGVYTFKVGLGEGE